MPLIPVRVPRELPALPAEVRRFLREAGRRIERFQAACRVPGFVASDFARVYAALQFLESSGLLPGHWFCEWGSGFGVVSCLAAMLGFDAWGIEVEQELVEAARELADDFALPVEFARGSFIPPGAQGRVAGDGKFAWLSTAQASAYERMEVELDDFDVVFAYPWPDEERLTADLFCRHARRGALLMTYHGGEEVRLRQNAGRERGDKKPTATGPVAFPG